MKTFTIVTLLSTALLPFTSAAPSSAPLEKRRPGESYLYPGGLGDPLNAGFLANQPVAKVTSKIYWYDWTKLTKGCKKHGNDVGCQDNMIDIFDVAYEDAPGHVWTMCRCRDNTAASEEDLIREVGRVPAGLRQFVRSYMAFNTKPNPSGAYSINNDVVFSGSISPTVMLHETAHAVDGSNNWFDFTQQYQDALNKDTCWADPYAKSSNAESWAQMLVLTRYRTTIGELPKGGQAMAESCLWNQLWAVHYQTWPLISAGFKKEKTWPRDEEVFRV